MNVAFWIFFFVLILALFLVLGFKKETSEEAFLSLDDYKNVSRDRYISIGKHRYNRLTDPVDIFRPGITRTLDEAGIHNLNEKVKKALVSNEVINKRNNLTNTEIVQSDVKEKFPLENNVLKEAKKCEAVLTRDACAKLSDPDFSRRCGVCILGGTDTMEKNKGAHIGGMLLMENDRMMAEKLAQGTGKDPIYEPTTGSCPAGYMYVDRVKCEKAVNRQNCKEAGKSGGFLGGKTIEGKEVIKDSCAFCPQSSEENVYLYEPKKRSFPIAVRIITPSGTGLNTVRIEAYNPTTRTESVLATGSAMGGEEMYLNLSGIVSEGQNIKFKFVQQFPHVPRGKKEVFQFREYGFAKDEARNICKSVGAELATIEQLTDAYNKGAQNCSFGWVADGSNTVAFPMQVGKMRDDLDGRTGTSGVCGGKVGVTTAESGFKNEKGEPQNKFSAWCYGVKPKVGNYQDPTGGMTLRIAPFFRSEGNKSIPSQEDLPDINSQYGNDYIAPNYRGVIVQWEMRTETSIVPRRAGIESSIVNVMGQNPNTTTTDGFKIFKILRRRGMFSSSVRNSGAMITSPNSSTNSNIMANQYWIWSNQTDNSEFYFTAQVPGIFKHPFYTEDIALCPRGPLVGEKTTLDLLKVSPCLKEGQGPGNYSIDCLKFLFQGAGGDVYNGKLSPLQGDVRELMYDKNNKPLEQDQILENLNELYSIATKGRNADGLIVSPENKKERRRIINDAGMKLFGMEIVTPCEEVTESATGDIILQPKTAPFDAECLDYLFLNTGTDKNRGMEGIRNTGLKATYTAIGDRFSGLLINEVDSAENKEKYPFQTCQRVGSAAPIDNTGKVNESAVAAANSFAMANSGSLRDAQNFFNGIFTSANMTVDGEGTDNMSLVRQQEEAIRKCYGITKVIEPKRASGCGVMARYVRVLRPLSGNAANIYTWPDDSVGRRTYSSQIRLAQVEVFNEMNEEIAKGKPVFSANKYPGTDPKNVNQGKTIARHTEVYADSDSANDADNYWMVDLGDFFEVRKVKVYLTTHNNHKMFDAIVQLLDADKKVIAHKVIGSEITQSPYHSIGTFSFGKMDVTSPVQLGEIRPGAVIYLQSAVMNDGALGARSVGYDTYACQFGSLNGQNGNRKDLELTITQGLSNINGTISFQYRNKYYLFAHPQNNTNGHKGCYYMQMSASTSEEYRKAASWVVKPALSGAPGWFSLQNVQYPNMYLAVLAQAGNWGLVMASPLQQNDITYQMLASWRANKANTVA